MKILLLLAFNLITILSLMAQEPHDQLAIDVSQTVIQAADQAGVPPPARQQVRARAAAVRDAAHPVAATADCPHARPSGTVAQEEDDAFNTAGTQAVENQIHFFFDLQFRVTGSNGQMAFASMPIPRIDFNSALRNYATSNNMTMAQVMSLNNTQLAQIIRDSSTLTGQELEDSVSNALVLLSISNITDEQQIYQTVGNAMRNASFGRKIGLLATFLASFNDNYDNDRASGGTVHLTTMMSAIRTNLVTGSTIDAGVCRDMHQAGVKLARAMGIDEAFGVGFATRGGGHRTMVLTDPHNRANVYQLNYGRVSTNVAVAGPTALSQNGTIPDAGIRFRMYNGNDQPAIILPSDRGSILNLVTGGQDSDLDALHHSNVTINQGGIETPYGTIRIFHAQADQGNGEQVTGVAYNVRVNYNDTFYGEYGIAGFAASRETEAGHMNAGGIYAQISQGVNLSLYRSEDFRLYAHGELQLRGMWAHTSLGNESGEVFDYNVAAQYGLGAEYRTGPIRHNTSVLFQTAIDQANAIDAGQGVHLFTPTILMQHRLTADLGSGVEGNLMFGIGYRDLGTDDYWQYTAGAGINSTNTGTSLQIGSTGAISDDLPLWVPGSERVGTMTFRQNITPNLYLSADGNQSFETINNHSLMFNLGGRF